MSYCIYLRKSRADAELEARGEGETLARHEKTLLELAQKMNIHISKIYKEIVSGETIAARPIVQQLLSDVEKGFWQGVLVMEIERLGRGDTIDQGIIAQTFKFTDTQIITPNKTYNPGNEFDEEYFEFGLFMSRREYKTINRRLQAGRLASVKEGKWVCSIPPYGYEQVKLKHDKGYTLSPLPAEADTVKMIFHYYTDGKITADGPQHMGAQLIAYELNKLHIPTRSGKPWTLQKVRDILKNPVYAGKVRWGYRPQVKKINGGEVSISRPKNEYQVFDGLHPALVSEDTWNKAQTIAASHYKTPVPGNRSAKNPLRGLVYCSACGKVMQRKPYKQNNTKDSLICATPGCHNYSAALVNVEKKIIEFLAEWLKDYKLEVENQSFKGGIKLQIADDIKTQEELLRQLDKEYQDLQMQSDNVYDLLEKGIYSVDKFKERRQLIDDKIAENQSQTDAVQNRLQELKNQEKNITEFIPKVENLLNVYDNLTSAKDKNEMLSEVIDHVVYTRTSAGKYVDAFNFDITVYPKIPSIR